MKTRLLFFAGLLFISLITFGQVNLVIFSEDGDKFYAYINGIKQNDNAESNVKVTGVTPNISLRIEFEDKALPQLKQNMALEPGFEHTAKIKRDMKKQMKLRYFGSTPLDSGTSGSIPTVAYHTADDSKAGNSTTTNNNGMNYNNTSTTIQTSTITTTPAGTININMPVVDLNFNGTDMNTGIVTQSSTSTTVTNSSSSYNSSPSNQHHHQHANQSEMESTTLSASGCRAPMPQASFDSMKKSIEAKPFSDTKLSTAKIAAKGNCMSVSQVKEICKLFSMDDDKLGYAKFAYDYCVNKTDFYQVSEVFSFSTTTDDLNKFLEGH